MLLIIIACLVAAAFIVMAIVATIKQETILETMQRWRTWLFNGLAGTIVLLPDLLQALLGFQWGTLIPAQYMPWVTLAIVIVNVWMRPRPAVLPSDPEAKK